MLRILCKSLFKIDTTSADSTFMEGTSYYTHRIYPTDIIVRKPFVDPKTKEESPFRTKPFLIVTSDTEDWNDGNIGLQFTEYNGRFNPQVKSNERIPVNNDLVLIAIPFNGKLAPIEESPYFSIVKYTIAKSEEHNITIEGVDAKYCKVLYLLVKINDKMDEIYDAEGHYSINIPVMSYSRHVAYGVKSKANETNTTYNNYTVNVEITDSECSLTINPIVISSDFDEEAYKDIPIVTLYKPAQKEIRKPQNRNDGQKNTPNGNRPVRIK